MCNARWAPRFYHLTNIWKTVPFWENGEVQGQAADLSSWLIIYQVKISINRLTLCNFGLRWVKKFILDASTESLSAVTLGRHSRSKRLVDPGNKRSYGCLWSATYTFTQSVSQQIIVQVNPHSKVGTEPGLQSPQVRNIYRRLRDNFFPGS